MNTYSFEVSFTTGKIYSDLIELVVNDYNSTTFNFIFDQDGRKVFKLLYPDETIYVTDITDDSLILGKGILNQEGCYKFEISLYGDDNRLTATSIGTFHVRLELVSTDETVTPDDRIPILDGLINEVNTAINAANNLDIDAEKVNTTTTVTITKKDGTQKTVEINDGAIGPIGETGPQGEKGDKGDKGDDGVVQYTAGENITIEDNVISAKGGAEGLGYLGKLTDYTEDSPLDITTLEKGIYTLMYNPAGEENSEDAVAYLKATYNGVDITGNTTLCTGAYISCSVPIYIEVTTPISEITEENTVMGYLCWTERSSAQGYDHYDTRKIKISNTGIDLTDAYAQSLDHLMNTNGTQTVTGLKTFETLPVSEVVPTSDNELVNKKYVDNLSSDTAIKTYYFDLTDIELPSPSTYGPQGLTNDTFTSTMELLINDSLEKGSTPSQFYFAEPYLFILQFKNGQNVIAQKQLFSNIYGSFNIQGMSILTQQYAIDGYLLGSYDFNIKGTYDSTTNKFTASGTFNITTQTNNAAYNVYYINNNFLKKSNTTSFTPTGDYNPSTKKYVDDKSAGVYSIKTTQSIDYSGTYIELDDTTKTSLQTAIRNAYTNSYNQFMIILRSGTSDIVDYHSVSTTALTDKPETISLYSNLYSPNGFTGQANSPIKSARMDISLTWSGTTATVSSAYIYPDTRYVLGTDNLIEYTPTEDYHPATKKYVDDSITTTITTALESDY